MISNIQYIQSQFILKLFVLAIININVIFSFIYLNTIDGHGKILDLFTTAMNKIISTKYFPNAYGYGQQSIFALQNQSDSNQNMTHLDLTPNNITRLFSTSSGNSLDVSVEPTPIPIKIDNKTKFKIYFYQLNSSQIQVHVDYDFIIIKDDREVFSAAKQIQQPLLHTAEGIVTIPYQFITNGNYTLKVLIFGINFIPISPEESTFKITVD